MSLASGRGVSYGRMVPGLMGTAAARLKRRIEMLLNSPGRVVGWRVRLRALVAVGLLFMAGLGSAVLMACSEQSEDADPLLMEEAGVRLAADPFPADIER